MIYRGTMDYPVSFIIAFLFPWVFASLIHSTETILSVVCFFAFTVAILAAYANPYIFFCETVKEATLFETNFRLSLK